MRLVRPGEASSDARGTSAKRAGPPGRTRRSADAPSEQATALPVGCHRQVSSPAFRDGAAHCAVAATEQWTSPPFGTGRNGRGVGGGSRSRRAKRGRSDGGLRHIPRIGSPAAAMRPGIVSTVNASGSTAATSSHWSGAETRASGVGRTEYADAIVRSRAFWPKSTKTPTRSATRHVVVATAWSPMRRSTSSASAFAKRRTSGNGSSGLIGARMCSPVAPDVFG